MHNTVTLTDERLLAARVAAYVAQHGAQQCGPCLFGLRALAERVRAIARGEPDAADAHARLGRLSRQIARRGACAHPDGVLSFVASAVRAFAAEMHNHLDGRCAAGDHRDLLPMPVQQGAWR